MTDNYDDRILLAYYALNQARHVIDGGAQGDSVDEQIKHVINEFYKTQQELNQLKKTHQEVVDKLNKQELINVLNIVSKKADADFKQKVEQGFKPNWAQDSFLPILAKFNLQIVEKQN